MSDDVLQQGSSGDDVSEMQTLLRHLSFYAGSIDGVFGPTTEAAVAAYREWGGHGYGVEADAQVRAALAGHVEQYSQQDGEQQHAAVDVVSLQTHLQALNFYAGSIDGFLGSVTQAAVSAYREWGGLGHGEADEHLLATLIGHAQQYSQPSEHAAEPPAEQHAGQHAGQGGGADVAAGRAKPNLPKPLGNQDIDDPGTEEAPAPELDEFVSAAQ
jgi:peptidoglycan hydrolase-like protein with peptidoglycan-binding domain